MESEGTSLIKTDELLKDSLIEDETSSVNTEDLLDSKESKDDAEERLGDS